MKHLYILINILLIFNISFSQSKKPRMSRYGFEINYKPSIYYNTFISYNNGPKLYFSINVQNDILQFKKDQNKYLAEFDVAINIKNITESTTLYSQSWSESIELDEFQVTNSKRNYQNSRITLPLDLKPGKYKVLVELSDAQTQNNFYSKRDLEIIDQSDKKLPHSRPVFVKSKTFSDQEFLISSFSDIVEFNESPNVLIEYFSSLNDTIKIESELFKKAKNKSYKIVNKSSYLHPSINGYNYFVENINDSLLFEGEYILKYTLLYTKFKEVVKDTFKIIWYEKPIYLYKYDLAIRPMQYIMSPEEYERVEDLSHDELEKWFTDYWKKKDSTPHTPYNEVQNEFYSRVQQAIQEFSLRFKEGWRTERGEALILYGNPTKIDKEHHSVNSKPFEIWYYDNLDKKITFVDTYDNGDFKLVSIDNIKDD